MPEITEDSPFNYNLNLTTINIDSVITTQENYQINKTIAGILRGQKDAYRCIGGFFSNFSLDEITFLLNMFKESLQHDHPNHNTSFSQSVLFTALLLRSEGQTDIDDVDLLVKSRYNAFFLLSFEVQCRSLNKTPRYSSYSLVDLETKNAVGSKTLKYFLDIYETKGYDALREEVTNA